MRYLLSSMFIEIENRMVVARDKWGRKGKESFCLMGIEFSFSR